MDYRTIRHRKLRLSKICALVVESDAHQLIAISTILKELGVSYKRNTDGRQVVAMAERMQPRPNLILLGLELPDQDPFALCTAIRQSQALRHVPVIATGGSKWLPAQPCLRDGGFSGFLITPLPRKQVGPLFEHVLAGKPLWHDAV